MLEQDFFIRFKYLTKPITNGEGAFNRDLCDFCPYSSVTTYELWLADQAANYPILGL
jgi:hypothetical protein